MKQIYIAPEMEVVEIEEDALMLSLSAEDSLPDTDIGGDATGKDADVNKRRGKWGNLWESESRW